MIEISINDYTLFSNQRGLPSRENVFHNIVLCTPTISAGKIDTSLPRPVYSFALLPNTQFCVTYAPDEHFHVNIQLLGFGFSYLRQWDY